MAQRIAEQADSPESVDIQEPFDSPEPVQSPEPVERTNSLPCPESEATLSQGNLPSASVRTTTTSRHESLHSFEPASPSPEHPLAQGSPVLTSPAQEDRPFNPDSDFLHIEASHGGTFAFADRKTAGRADAYFPLGGRVGTSGLHTCVAIAWTLDAHRAFFAHVNAWSHAKLPYPRNYVDKEEGKEIQDAVVRQLQNEAEKMCWQPEHDEFGLDITACCRFPEFVVGGKKILVAGSYVVRGIREYFRSIADTMQEHAGGCEEMARQVSGFQESDLNKLREQIEEAEEAATGEDVRATMEAALDEVINAARMRRRAQTLSQRAGFDVERKPHGFVLANLNEKSNIVRAISSVSSVTHDGKERSDDFEGFFPRSGKALGSEVKVPLNWSFYPKSVQDLFQTMKESDGIEEEEFDTLTSRTPGSPWPESPDESIFEDTEYFAQVKSKASPDSIMH